MGRAMMSIPRSRATLSSWLLIILVLVAFGFDFAHGIALGQDKIAFHPIYRLRQTIAVAISRMQQPPLHGYLAYQSVIDALKQSGFPPLPEDGAPTDMPAWIAFLEDTARVDRTLQAARDAIVDPALPPQLLTGNEVAYADYAYFSFRLFGMHISALYYFFFVLLGVSCLLFVVQFRTSPFLLFLLVTYLAGLSLLQNYVHSQDPSWGSTLANSRFFEALSLLPAMHIFLVVWRRLPPSRSTFATVAVQAGLLAFLIDCRVTARWQIAMIVAAAAAMFVVDCWERRNWRPRWRLDASRGAWAAVVAVVALAAHMAMIEMSADKRYAAGTKYHIVWHEVLRGVLGSSLELQRDYLGRVIGIESPPDAVAYEAVSNDLTRRNDRSSPIAVVENGRILADVTRGWDAYERMARRLVIRMIIEHPAAVLTGVYYKFTEQLAEYSASDALAPRNFISAALLTALAALIWLGLGGGLGEWKSAACATFIVLAFAMTPPLVAPSALSVGTLLAFLVAIAIAVSALPLVLAGAASEAQTLLTRIRKRVAGRA
jgi:hypothetical protein